jgi:hypothetical protein
MVESLHGKLELDSLMIMKSNKWTLALIGAGLVSLPAVTQAEEAAKTTPSVLTGLSATTLSGYVDTSAHWNPGTGNANLPVYTPNGAAGSTKADGFNLDLVDVTISKPAGEGAWSAGYNASLLFGPDAVGYNNSFGSTASDFSLKDAYIDLHAPIGNGVSLKLGTMAEMLGYEVYESGNNPNYTRSYGYELEPTSLTGALATYTVSPVLTVMGGVFDTWSAGINSRNFLSSTGGSGNHSESFKTYGGMLMLTAPKSMGFLAGSTLSGGVISGYDALIDENVISYYAGGTFNTPISALKAGAAFDALSVSHIGGENWAVGTYLSYQATEKLTLLGRAEYLKDRGNSKIFVGTFGDPTTAMMPDESLGLTLTAQYDLWKNVMSRLEVRWDHALAGAGVWGGSTVNGPGSTIPGTEDNAVLVAANLIYKF